MLQQAIALVHSLSFRKALNPLSICTDSSAESLYGVSGFSPHRLRVFRIELCILCSKSPISILPTAAYPFPV